MEGGRQGAGGGGGGKNSFLGDLQGNTPGKIFYFFLFIELPLYKKQCI